MAFDLDDEELASTRKLYGLDKINGSDINVGSIEEAIKRCKELIKPKNSEWIGITNQNAIQIVLGNLDALCDMQKIADIELKNARKINEEHRIQNAELMKALNIAEKEKDEWIKEYQKLKEENKDV